MPKKNLAPWVVAGGAPGEAGHCQHCGQGLGITFPQSLNVMVAAMKAFTKDHARCTTKAWSEPVPQTPEEWVKGRDTGTSSMTICSVMAGRPLDRADIPHDPDDFGRCYRLLQLFPAWKFRLGELAVRYPEWELLVREWADLESRYEEELQSGSCPKLYAKMKEL